MASTHRTLVWVNRHGKETAVGAPPRAYSIPRVAPDGTRVAVSMKEGGQDIHLWDVSRRLLRQLTFDASPNTTLAWLDNERLAFSATVDGWGQALEQRADGLGAPRQITSGLPSFPSAASRDGALLIVREYLLMAAGTSESSRFRGPRRARRSSGRRPPRTIPPSRPTAGGWRTS